MLTKFVVVFLALSTFANAAPAMPRGVSVTVDGHTIHLREPAGPPSANSHKSELKLLASDIATDHQKVHNGAGTSNPPRPNPPRSNVPPPNRPKIKGHRSNVPPPNRPKTKGHRSNVPPPNRPKTKGHRSNTPPPNRPKTKGH